MVSGVLLLGSNWLFLPLAFGSYSDRFCLGLVVATGLTIGAQIASVRFGLTTDNNRVRIVRIAILVIVVHAILVAGRGAVLRGRGVSERVKIFGGARASTRLTRRRSVLRPAFHCIEQSRHGSILDRPGLAGTGNRLLAWGNIDLAEDCQIRVFDRRAGAAE